MTEEPFRDEEACFSCSSGDHIGDVQTATPHGAAAAAPAPEETAERGGLPATLAHHHLSWKSVLESSLGQQCEEAGLSLARIAEASRRGEFQDVVLSAGSEQAKGLLADCAALHGNLGMLKLCFAAGVSPRFRDRRGYGALHYAAAGGSTDCVEAALVLGNFDVDGWDAGRTLTPLMCAASCGNVPAMGALIRGGANVNLRGDDGITALHHAIRAGSAPAVNLLLDAGAEVDAPECCGESPLSAAASEGNAVLLDLLLERKAAADARWGKHKAAAIHVASQVGSAECIRVLLRHGASVDCANSRLQTALHLALLSQSLESVQVLLEAGADPNARDCENRTPLFCTASKGMCNHECLRLLLEFGANPNAQDSYGYTPLHVACLNENVNTSRILIESGADMTLETKGRVSALNFIVRKTPSLIPWMEHFFDSALDYAENSCYQKNELLLNFRAVVPPAHSRETDLLLAFVKEGQKLLLKHPLCESFLYLKWTKMKKYYYFIIAFYFNFMLLLTLYILCVFSNECLTLATANTTDCSRLATAEQRSLYVGSAYLHTARYLLISELIILGAKEVIQMCQGPWRDYLYSFENWLQWVVILHTALLCPVQLGDGGFLAPWQSQVAAFAIVFAWLHFTVLIGKFHHLGLYVQMFKIVSIDFGKFLLAYSSIIIAFSLSFDVLFNGYCSFINPIESLITTLVMMTGEIEFVEMFYDEQSRRSQILYPGTVHIIFSVFLLLIVLVLMNLLVGLAVSDINELKETAGLETLVRLTKLIASMEATLFGSFINILPDSLKNTLQRNSLLVRSAYRWVLSVHVDDPRDERLGQLTKDALLERVREKKVSRRGGISHPEDAGRLRLSCRIGGDRGGAALDPSAADLLLLVLQKLERLERRLVSKHK